MVEAAHEDRRRGGGWAVLGAILLLSAVLRFPGLTGGYWLDEAWTVTTAREMTRLSDVFADRNLVDNNHPLITAWVFLVGDGIAGRLLSFMSALAAVVSAWRIGARRGAAVGAGVGTVGGWTAAVVATSFPLAVYGTEARGFAPAIACALACLDLADDPRRSRARSVAFTLLALCGALAHFTFVAALAGAAAMSVSSRRWKDLLTLHLPALFAVTVVYLGFVRHLKIAGGTAGEAWHAAAGMASLLVNGPDPGSGSMLGSAVLFVGVVFLLTLVVRSRGFGGDPGLACAAVVSAVAAGGMLVARTLLYGHSDVVYPRYFLVAGVVALVACAVALAGASAGSPRGKTDPPPGPAEATPQGAGATAELGTTPTRPAHAASRVATILLAALCLAGVVRTLHFGLGPGRGDYLTPLVVVASSDAPTLTSDYDSRTLRLLAYYGPRLPALLRYSRDAQGGARWHLHNTGTNAPLPDRLDVGGVGYVLRHRYPVTGPSGWEWGLYERQ